MAIGFSDGKMAEDWGQFYNEGPQLTEAGSKTTEDNSEDLTPQEQDMKIHDYEDDMLKIAAGQDVVTYPTTHGSMFKQNDKGVIDPLFQRSYSPNESPADRKSMEEKEFMWDDRWPNPSLDENVTDPNHYTGMKFNPQLYMPYENPDHSRQMFGVLKDSADADLKVGELFRNTDWNKFQQEARESSNIEDERDLRKPVGEAVRNVIREDIAEGASNLVQGVLYR